MAELKFTIPDARMPEVVEAFGRGRGYSPEIADVDNPGEMIPNPQTEAQYARTQMMDDIIRHVKHYQGQKIAEIPIS